MRLTRLLLALTAAVAVSTPSLLAQVTLETNSGSSYSGEVLSNDGDSVEIETKSGKVKVPFDSLTLGSQYRLKRMEAGDDAQGQLDLAEWCVGKTLYEEARTHYRKALAADAAMGPEINAKVVKARTTAATELLQRAKALQADGKPAEARRVLSTLVQELPLEPASEEARKLLAEETAQRKQNALSDHYKAAARGAGRGAGQAAPDAPMRANGQPFSEPTRKLFAPIIEAYQKMLDATQEGLVKGDTAGIKEFEKALKEGEKIRKEAEKIRAKAAGDEEVNEALALVDSKLEEAVVDVRINLVDNYMLRTSYNQAADVVKAGLVEYPKNERLRGAMNRVTAASADNGGGGWLLGR